MQLPGAALQFIRSIPTYGARLYELFNAVQQQTTRVETQGNLNATGDPPVPPPPDAVRVTNGPSGEFQIAITHNGQFNRGVGFKVHWDTSPAFTNPHSIDLGDSRNDSSLYLPGQTVYFRASAAYPNGPNSAWTYHGTANAPAAVVGGVRGVRAPGMGSGTGAPGDQSGGPGPVQQRNAQSGYDWTAQQRTAGAGFGASAQGSPAGISASVIAGGGGGGGGPVVQLPLYDTYANWTATKYPPAQYALNTTFTITDWNFVTYIVRLVGGVNKWVYESGVYSVVQSAIPTTGFNGAALGTNDAGLQVSITDFSHLLQWSGSAWGWGFGESGSGYFADFAVAPTGSGWHLCDGSAGIKYLKADGTTGTVTLPNTNGSAAYRKGGSSYASTITPAASPTVVPTGSVSVSAAGSFAGTPAPLTTAAVTPTGAVNAVTQVAGSATSYTPAGSVTVVASAAFTGATDTVSLAGGDPVANYEAITYFRQ